MALRLEAEERRKRAARAMFDEWAMSYDSSIKAEFERNSGIAYEEYLEQLLSTIEAPEGGRVLDVATGTALMAIAIARKMQGNCHVIGIDMTPGMLSQARRNIERSGMGDAITLAEHSAEELPFDVVNCSLAIHHMRVPKALMEMTRVLRAGGQLVIADFLAPPTWETPMGRIGVPAFRFIKRFSADKKERADIGYAAIYPRRRWERLLLQNGLTMSEFRQYPKQGMQQWEPVPCILAAHRRSGT